MSGNVAVDAEALREEVRKKSREVATNPHGTFHFHTGRPLAALLGYDAAVVGALPDAAVESFAGVANPSLLRPLRRGERVVDVDRRPVLIASSRPIASEVPGAWWESI